MIYASALLTHLQVILVPGYICKYDIDFVSYKIEKKDFHKKVKEIINKGWAIKTVKESSDMQKLIKCLKYRVQILNIGWSEKN